MKRRWLLWLVGLGAAAVLLAAAAPWIVHGWWVARSSNAVRRGVARATELGCFACHGVAGTGGLPDPGPAGQEVPAWSGGVWMMYVENDVEIREYILNGVSDRRRGNAAGESRVIRMPAYAEQVGGTDLEDLVAAFKVLGGMTLPAAESPARRGLQAARRRNCFACHGPAGAGGLPNPGSLTGFVPGWYGPDFADLVRDRAEFDAWVRMGTLERLERHAIASFFLRRQRLRMPAYEQVVDSELDELWAYVTWLAQTEGGHRGATKPW